MHSENGPDSKCLKLSAAMFIIWTLCVFKSRIILTY